MAKIYLNSQMNGLRAGVLFKRGVGETKDRHLIDWFKRRGYRVEETVEERLKNGERFDAERLRTMTVAEIKAYAKTIGKKYTARSASNKEKLIQNIAGD